MSISGSLARSLPFHSSMFTTMGQVIVIASAPMVSAWRTELDNQPKTLIFSETDFLVALDAIINERPDVIALDPMFAATARGAALVARVKADPQLKRSEIRTLVRDDVDSPPTKVNDPDGSASMSSQPLDTCGTRRAPRFPMEATIEAKVNGTPGHLVNLSVTGSQMLAAIRLRPSEAIRVSLADELSELRLNGNIAWVSLEISSKSHSQRYRFGVEFRDADEDMLEQFVARHRDDR